MTDWRIGWMCDRDGRRARALASTACVRGVTTDYREALADPAVSSVSIAVGHADHASLVLDALRAGKHTLMEKPIALREHDAIEIVQEAAARGLVLAVVSQHRYDPVVRSVKRWIDGGLLGDIACVTVQLECSRDRAYYTTSDWRGTWCGEGGSVLINQGYHCVDVLRWLCGPIGDVAAMLGTVRLGDTIETEDTFSATLRLKCGGLATLAITSAGTRLWQSRIQVVGTGGTVTFDLDHPGKIHEWSGTHALARRATKLAAELDRVGLPPGVDYYGVSHRSQVADFCRAVETGQALEVSPGDAIETLRVIGRLYSSAIWQSAVREAVDAKELWC